jgi:predicted transcriptional regulator
MPTACAAGDPNSTIVTFMAEDERFLRLSRTDAADRGFLHQGRADTARAGYLMKRRTGTFREFKEYTLAVAPGERKVDPSEPRIWCEPAEEVQFASLEAGAKLLSAKNRALLRTIAERHTKSVAELHAMTDRAEQNVSRTLKKLETAGVVRLVKGEGRARRPVLAARKVHFEIDLLGSE